MRLNGKQILERGIVNGKIDKDCIQQVGIDLRVIEIERVFGGGVIPRDGKTLLAKREKVKRETPKDIKSLGVQGAVWMLQPGVYDITFEQGCDIPNNVVGIIIHRSSLLRNGGILRSGEFDPGFKTKHMGVTMTINIPMLVEFKARLAQFTALEAYNVSEEDLYNGQWQEDMQRGPVNNRAEGQHAFAFDNKAEAASQEVKDEEE